MSVEHRRAVKRTLIYGTISIILYALLYHFEIQVLELSKEGKWNFFIPMLIA